jgi:Zn-dependent protease with chaperone function
MKRRPDRSLLVLLPALLGFVVFGAARVVAPVTLIGLVFGEPLEFAVVATVLGLGGAALLFVRPVELKVAQLIAPSREPTSEEAARIEPLLGRIGERAGLRTDRLIVRVEDDHEMNASAGAAHLVFVTTGALRRADDELEALLAHELGHHRGLHPVAVALLWWLSLPGVALVAVYRVLRRLVARLTGRLPPLAVLARIVLNVWQISVMWLYFVAQVLAQGAARASEYTADRAAASWGYGNALATVLASLGPSPRAGLLERMMDTHPPTESRVARLGR